PKTRYLEQLKRKTTTTRRVCSISSPKLQARERENVGRYCARPPRRGAEILAEESSSSVGFAEVVK
ncbi:unnamed protein product, partial [Thlaspi arvense]